MILCVVMELKYCMDCFSICSIPQVQFTCTLQPRIFEMPSLKNQHAQCAEQGDKGVTRTIEFTGNPRILQGLNEIDH